MAIENLLLTAILVAVISLSLNVCGYSLHYVYVREDNNRSCPYNPCNTLAYYATHTNQYFLSHTEVVFLPGNHSLINMTIDVENVTTFSMVGKDENLTSWSNSAVIQCGGGAAVRFTLIRELKLENLTFTNCGEVVDFTNSTAFAALAFETVFDLTISGLVVTNSSGYGMYAERVFGQSSVVNSLFTYNSGTSEYDGGNAAFYYNNCPDTSDTSLLSVNHSQFLHGNGCHGNPLASGLVLFLSCTGINVNLTSVTLCGNQAHNLGTGGNLAVIYRNRTSVNTNSVVITQSYICNGIAHLGGGAFVSILEVKGNNQTGLTISQVLRVSNTYFVGNYAGRGGGAMNIIVHEQRDVYHQTGSITFEYCTFVNNSLETSLGGGAAATIVKQRLSGFEAHGLPQFDISFSNCRFANNVVVKGQYNSSSGSAVIFLMSEASFINCTFQRNNCSAISAIYSNFILEGKTLIEGNTGVDGAGLVLCDRSYIYLKPYTNITIANNHAQHLGGGIHAENECLQTKPPCFFQLDECILSHPELINTVHIYMVNNTAKIAGSAVYGGSVDYCYVFENEPEDISKLLGPEVFKKVFKIDHAPLDFSYITSNPFRVCFCNDTQFPDCNKVIRDVTIYPGETLTVLAVTAGQSDGTVPGVVLASTDQSSEASIADPLQLSQAINGDSCASLQYTVLSGGDTKTAQIELTVQQPLFNKGFQYHIQPQQIQVSFKQCPLGFELTEDSCKCTGILAINNVECNISILSIHRTPPAWIGYYQLPMNDSADTNRSRLVVFHYHCPFDYCQTHDVNIRVSDNWIDEDEQCAFNRTGILCGACPSELSLALGSSECLRCSNYYLLLLLPFALAGLLLVGFLLTCNITVSQGTLSGLIFYANFVQVNRAIFFRLTHNMWNQFLSLFIAWINLDLGIRTCFYSSMDAYQKTWLQFAFPVYIWLITAVIILLSRHTTVAKLIGKNAVQVLATLFLLSYAKLLRTTISVLSFAVLTISQGNQTITKTVWLPDGHVQYLDGKHIPLFTIALLISVFLLPYTLVLLTIQLLQKFNSRLLFWVARLKPFLDAYMGAYNDQYRCWTGVLLLARNILFATYTFGDPKLSMMLTAVACTGVLTIGWVLPGKSNGIYSQWPLNILESSFILNLAVLSVATGYFLNNGGNQEILSCASATVAFVTFIGIMLFHTYKLVKGTRTWQYLAVCFQQKQQDAPALQRSEPSITSSAIPQFDQYREPLLSDH